MWSSEQQAVNATAYTAAAHAARLTEDRGGGGGHAHQLVSDSLQVFIYSSALFFGKSWMVLFEREIERDSVRWRKRADRPLPPRLSGKERWAAKSAGATKLSVMSMEAHRRCVLINGCTEEDGKSGADPEQVFYAAGYSALIGQNPG